MRENYEYLIGNKVFRSVPGGIIKEYAKDENGAIRLIRQYKPSDITYGQRFSAFLGDAKKLKFFKGLSGALAVAGVAVDTIKTAIQREETTGRKLTNSEWAALIISSVGVEATSTLLTGAIGSLVANMIAPGVPVANTIIGGVVGSIVGYFASKRVDPEELKRRLEIQLVGLFDQLF